VIRSQSIKRKQMLLLMLTSGVALVLACSAFLAYERLSFRKGLTHKLESLAAMVGTAATAAIEFRDAKSAQEILATLADEENITAAVIYDRERRPFVQYVRADPAGKQASFTPPAPLSDGHDFTTTHVSLFRRITSRGERVGIIYLESDLHELSGRLHQYVQIVLWVLLASSFVALILSARLQRVIVDPILALAGTAKKVSAEKNYSLRVKVQTRDELGQLMTTFNEMLQQIQERDAALQRANDELDTRVRERTSELQQQILDRSKTEKDLQQQLTRISLLNSITRAIAARQDLESVVKVVLRHLEDQLPIDFGEVQLYDRQTRTISPARHGTAYYRRQGAFTSNTPVEGSGLEPCVEGKTVVAGEPSKAEGLLKTRMETLDLKSLIGVPLMVEEELFGILLTARKAAHAFSSGECEFLRMLSEQVALAAHQARLHAQLQRAYDELRQTQIAIMQEERLRALGQMASGIAHDINNALCPIVVYADLLLSNEKSLTESGLKNLQNIKTSGEDIAHIVSRMREFYRRRDDRDSHLPVNLNRIATQVIDLTRPRWRDIPQARGLMIELRTEFEDGLPQVAASESELREAITNLLLNAIDAMPQGGELVIRSVTRAWIADGEGIRKPSHVSMEVRDTGIGMTEEIRKRCLEPFFSTKGKRGTGLGLAMVYGVMERHEGTIEIESEPGKGTTMRLVFPMRELTAAASGRAKPTHAPLPTLRILCIDDEPLLREMLEQLLENAGHIAALADSGQAGVEMFRNARQLGEPFDVVITDLGMPYLDGRQVAQTIKRETPDMPVIMLTGWGTMMKDDGDTPTQVDAVLSKPPKINELFETISRVLEIRRSQRPPLDKAA
jgi:signal transduction histidine kinase/ActR/RegA family two-component response regulator/HAMP domain-containing protein